MAGFGENSTLPSMSRWYARWLSFPYLHPDGEAGATQQVGGGAVHCLASTLFLLRYSLLLW